LDDDGGTHNGASDEYSGDDYFGGGQKIRSVLVIQYFVI
jgi:hypothetical protein